MSRIGKQKINILDGVSVKITEDFVVINGEKGELKIKILPGLNIKIDKNEISILPNNDKNQTKMNWGTMRSLVNNAIIGVKNGFSKTLEINGVGYKAEVNDKKLILKVGYSHIVEFNIPKNINISVNKNKITVSGFDKVLVGQVAANIRAVRKPEPYLGKGIKYEDEVIIRKAGKKAVGSA